MFKVNQFIGAFLMCLSFLSIADSSLSSNDLISVKKIINEACIACHGIDGNSQLGMNPKLSSQHSSYLTKQLNAFKAGLRKNAVMAGMVMNLSIKDMENLGVYYSEQELSLSEAKKNGQGSMGEKIFRAGLRDKEVPACASCHGPAGHGIPDLYPRLNAQHSEYTVIQLNSYRNEERPGKIMQKISQKLTQKEMEAVADYIQGLR